MLYPTRSEQVNWKKICQFLSQFNFVNNFLIINFFFWNFKNFARIHSYLYLDILHNGTFFYSRY